MHTNTNTSNTTNSNNHTSTNTNTCTITNNTKRVRPISILRLSLPRLLDSNFPETPHVDMRTPSLEIKMLLESNLLKSSLRKKHGDLNKTVPKQVKNSAKTSLQLVDVMFICLLCLVWFTVCCCF